MREGALNGGGPPTHTWRPITQSALLSVREFHITQEIFGTHCDPQAPGDALCCIIRG